MKDDLAKAPDLVEFVQQQARYEAIKMVLEEKDKSIERLENDLKKAGQRKEDLKQMHNNYFLQVQTLINQKSIGSSREATGSNQEDKSQLQEKSVSTEGRKALDGKICKNCKEPFFYNKSEKRSM